MFLFVAFLYISVASLKFVKGTQVFYATSSDSLVQNSSCIVDNEVLHPCVTLDVLVKDYTFSFSTNNGNISIYLIHDKYYIFTNISLFFSNLSTVEIRPWRQKKQASITCEGDFTIECTNVCEIYLQSIKFCQCGKLRPVIGLSMDSSTSKIVILKNNIFTKSRYSSVQVLCSIKELHISGCLFDGTLYDYEVYILTSSNHSNNTAAIRDTTFMNNAAGSLYFFSYPIKTILKIQNCNFVNNTVSKNYTGTYGAVIKIYSFVDIYIINCTFIHNSMSSTVVVECPNSNSLCFTTAIIHVSNSNFISNSGRSGGGLFITGKFCIEVYKSVFIENQVSSKGGVLYIEFSNSLLISNCTFRNNAAAHGGVVFLDEVGSVSIDSSNFTGNNAGVVGGAVYQKSGDLHSSFTNFSNCVFINNSAAFGGALSTHSKYPIDFYRCNTLTVINSSFLNNMASQYGGALSVYWCRVTLYHLTLSGHLAKIEAGALRIVGDVKGGELFIQNCTLTNNTASNGGAMILQYASSNGNTHLSHLKFISNHATFKGGAITLHEYEGRISVISLTNCSFTNNEVTNERGKGGALALEGKIQVIMNSCNFTHNNASYGGAVYINRTSCFSKHCTFSENVARTGGAVAGIAAYVDFMNLNMNKNLASENGGGMALSNSSLNISGDSNFTSNTVTSATGRGGAIYIEDRIDDCVTQSCLLFWANNTRLHFLRNSANIGNVIYGGMLDRCISPFGLTYASLIQTTDAVLVNNSNYDVWSHAITSDVTKICYCENILLSSCSLREVKTWQYPGQSLNVCVVCLDQMEQTMTCNVKGEFKDTKFQIGRGENSRLIFDRENLTFHTFTNQENLNTSALIIKGDIICDQSMWNTLKV